MSMNKQVELLAPACSYEGFLAVLEAGADAAYISGQAFGARAYARNCTQEELIRCIDLAHIQGKRLYLTVNTLLKNRELRQELIPYLSPLVEAGLDAVLVQDLGVLRFLHRIFPTLPLHASTQMTVTGPETLSFLKKLGVTRVVPARELSLSEIRALHEAEDMEIEVFVHGSLCYSYSGMCLLSSFLGGRSGNRGRCAQPCRLTYETEEGRSSSPLSMKDLNTITLLPRILEAGAVSLKIEGRMKSPAYAASVTRIYRKYLDLALKGGDYEVSPADLQALRQTYSRGGSCTGYYETRNGPEMIYFQNEKKIGGSDQKQPERFPLPRLGVRGNVILRQGEEARLELTAENRDRKLSLTVSGAPVQKAQAAPLTRDGVLRQMERMGDSAFSWEELDIDLEEGSFLPVSALNRLRRDGVTALEEAFCGPFRRPASHEASGEERTLSENHMQSGQSLRVLEKEDLAEKRRSEEIAPEPALFVSCLSLEQGRLCLEHPGVMGLYLPLDVAIDLEDALSQSKKPWYLALPHVLRGTDLAEATQVIEEGLSLGAKGFLVRNLETYSLLEKMGLSQSCVTDHTLYTWNDEAVDFWLERKALRVTAPLELSKKELSHREAARGELVVYGYLPMMISAQCVRKSCGHCDHSSSAAWLTDRYHTRFPSKCFCAPWKAKSTVHPGICYNILYNSVPLSLLPVTEQLRLSGFGTLRAELTLEDGQQTQRILEELTGADNGRTPASLGEGFTRGHYRKGVE